MMYEPDTRSGGESRRAPTAQDHDRRRTVRVLLHNVRGTAVWRGEDGDVSREVSVLNISGLGGALLAEDGPPEGQSLRLTLSCDAGTMDAVDGTVVARTSDASGKLVLHVAFSNWASMDWLVGKHRERRLWKRYPANRSRASLTWHEGGAERSIQCDVLNISGGGAAFIAETLPPHGVPLWLQVEGVDRDASPIGPVESVLVDASVDPLKLRVAHIQFLDACPMELFEYVIGEPS